MRGKVVVFPAPAEEVTKGGVHLPKDAQRRPIHGVVLEIGPLLEGVPEGQFVEGDIVIFPQYAGTEVVMEDDDGSEQKVLILDYENIIAKIEVGDGEQKARS